MTLLDVSIVNVALPSIEAGLAADDAHIQWIVAGYSLSFGLVLVPAGRLGDLLGRRSMFLLGLIGFVVASAACGLTQDAAWLAVTRIVQGAFAGILNPQVIALIQDLFRGPARARAFGYFGMTIGVSTAIGPLLGGVLVSSLGPELGWRSVFLINVPVGLVVVPLAARWLRGHGSAAAQRRSGSGGGLGLDGVGLVLIAGIVLAVMWPFIAGTESDRGLAGAPWSLLGVAAVLAVVLVLWERRQDGRGRPAILPGVLVRNRGFVLGASLGAAYFGGFTGIFIVATMWLQQGVGLPAWLAGMAQMPFAVASAVSAARSGRRVSQRGRRVVVGGLLLMMTGVAALSLLMALRPEEPWTVWVVPVLLGIAGAGSGSVISPNQALTLADVPTRHAGTASGLLQTLQRLGATVGLALMTSLFFSVVDADGSLAAYSRGLAVSTAFTLILLGVALVIALVDQRGHPHAHDEADAGR
jgi:MFS family permease